MPASVKPSRTCLSHGETGSGFDSPVSLELANEGGVDQWIGRCLMLILG